MPYNNKRKSSYLNRKINQVMTQKTERSNIFEMYDVGQVANGLVTTPTVPHPNRTVTFSHCFLGDKDQMKDAINESLAAPSSVNEHISFRNYSEKWRITNALKFPVYVSVYEAVALSDIDVNNDITDLANPATAVAEESVNRSSLPQDDFFSSKFAPGWAIAQLFKHNIRQGTPIPSALPTLERTHYNDTDFGFSEKLACMSRLVHATSFKFPDMKMRIFKRRTVTLMAGQTLTEVLKKKYFKLSDKDRDITDNYILRGARCLIFHAVGSTVHDNVGTFNEIGRSEILLDIEWKRYMRVNINDVMASHDQDKRTNDFNFPVIAAGVQVMPNIEAETE